MERAELKGSATVFRNAECPFQHLSTKHVASKGVHIDLQAAARSNSGRSAALGKFAEYVCSRNSSPGAPEEIQYDEIASTSNLLNPFSPATLGEVLPIPLTRSLEDTWAKVGETASALVGHLAMRHAEMFMMSGHHSVAAHAVMEELANERNCDILSYLQSSAMFSLPAISDRDFGGIPILEHDAKALVNYQLIQERWQKRVEIQQMNEMIADRPLLVETVLKMQWTMCKLLEDFLRLHPEYIEGSLAFGEIGLVTDSTGKVVPSSRLLKVIFHNLGPWLLQHSNYSVVDQIVMSLAKARSERAFEQYIVVLRRTGEQLLYVGIQKKVCPAKTTLLRIVNHIAKGKEL